MEWSTWMRSWIDVGLTAPGCSHPCVLLMDSRSLHSVNSINTTAGKLEKLLQNLELILRLVWTFSVVILWPLCIHGSDAAELKVSIKTSRRTKRSIYILQLLWSRCWELWFHWVRQCLLNVVLGAGSIQPVAGSVKLKSGLRIWIFFNFRNWHTVEPLYNTVHYRRY